MRALVRRVTRWSFALLLLPVAIGLSWAVWDLAGRVGRSVEFWVPLLAGGAIWLVLFVSLPRPLWLYVVGHELTHALWALLFGGRVKSFKATRSGGHVVVTKTNSLIVLAPYFFPLYAVLWCIGFLALAWFLGWKRHVPWFHLGLGMTYAFHLTLTAVVLRTRQPDLESEGWIFSGVIIWLGHAVLLLAAIPLLGPVVAPVDAVTVAGDRVWRVLLTLVRGVSNGLR